MAAERGLHDVHQRWLKQPQLLRKGQHRGTLACIARPMQALQHALIDPLQQAFELGGESRQRIGVTGGLRLWERHPHTCARPAASRSAKNSAKPDTRSHLVTIR